MEAKDPDLIIKTVVAAPRSRNFYNFYINDSDEKRSMKPAALADFVEKLCPAIGGRARMMIYEFRPFYAEIETETLLELAEIPGEPEPRRALLFGGRKKAVRAVMEGRSKGDAVDRRRQGIFANILKLTKK